MLELCSVPFVFHPGDTELHTPQMINSSQYGTHSTVCFCNENICSRYDFRQKLGNISGRDFSEERQVTCGIVLVAVTLCQFLLQWLDCFKSFDPACLGNDAHLKAITFPAIMRQQLFHFAEQEKNNFANNNWADSRHLKLVKNYSAEISRGLCGAFERRAVITLENRV